ncbi:hypothetical protein ACVV2G_18725 [Streptomyces ziwulingensis]
MTAPATVVVRFIDSVLVSPVFQVTAAVSAPLPSSSRQDRGRSVPVSEWVPEVRPGIEAETQGPSCQLDEVVLGWGVLVNGGL